MITVQPFTLEVIKTHKCFYLLRHITGASELQILHNTPAGYIETNVADAFSMPNGAIIIGWKAPLNIAPMHNLVAVHGQTTENINLVPLERVIDIYDRPVDAQLGVFSFTGSDMILAPHLDWRCDNGKFGPLPFANPEGIFEAPSGIVVYEPILPVNGVGYIVYVEGVGKQDLANAYLNSDTRPVTGRTLWETLKLIREWAIVNKEPFNNTEAVAHKSHQFIRELKLTEQEIAVIDQQIPMQIANYLTGSTNARQRPDGVLPITDDVKDLLFSRLASCSVAALEYLNPGMWDLEELVSKEQEQLVIDEQIFEMLKQTFEADRPVIAIQHRVFNNKRMILDKISTNQL
jgi:hypothetical protein